MGIWPVKARVRLTARRKGEQKGHIARNYENETLCMFYKVGAPMSDNHIAVSGKCPQYFNKVLRDELIHTN